MRNFGTVISFFLLAGGMLVSGCSTASLSSKESSPYKISVQENASTRILFAEAYSNNEGFTVRGSVKTHNRNHRGMYGKVCVRVLDENERILESKMAALCPIRVTRGSSKFYASFDNAPPSGKSVHLAFKSE